MEDNKQLIGIRCHNFGESEQFLYTVLLKYFQASRVFFIVDELKELKYFPSALNKVSLNLEFLKDNALYSHNQVAWACGDYFYYAFRQAVEADFYWLIEPDVLLNLDSVEAFFGFFAEQDAEALVMNFALAPQGWSWYESAQRLLDPPYTCFFPLTRLSKKAIDIMFAKRQAISFDFLTDKSRAQFPNDEALLANALMAHGIELVNLTDYFPNNFDEFSIGPFKNKELSTKYAKNQIVHPVKDPDFYTGVFKKNIDLMFDKSLAHMLANTSLDDQELKAVQNYALELFNKRLAEDFYLKGKVSFTLQSLVASFRKDSKINFNKVVRANSELRFFMGKGKCIAFVFEAQAIAVHKRIYTKGVAEPAETSLTTLPVEPNVSLQQLQAEIEKILHKHENKALVFDKPRFKV